MGTIAKEVDVQWNCYNLYFCFTGQLLITWKHKLKVLNIVFPFCLGANLNLKGSGGKTPLGWARKQGHSNIVRLLEAAGDE